MITPAAQIARLEYVIRAQMAEIDRQRGEIANLVGRINGLMTAFEEKGTLGILQMMAHDTTLDPQIRIRAAGLAVPFERPKLSMTATTSVALFDLLEARRRKGKTIEHAPALNGTGEPAQHDPTTTDAPALDMAGVDPPAA